MVSNTRWVVNEYIHNLFRLHSNWGNQVFTITVSNIVNSYTGWSKFCVIKTLRIIHCLDVISNIFAKREISLVGF